jgi:hypothetical protein
MIKMIELEMKFNLKKCPYCKEIVQVPLLINKLTNEITLMSIKHLTCKNCNSFIDLNIYTTAYLNKIRKEKIKKLLEENNESCISKNS